MVKKSSSKVHTQNTVNMYALIKAAGTGPAGQAKTGPLLSVLRWVMIVYYVHHVVKIVT